MLETDVSFNEALFSNAASLLTSCIRYAQMLDKARPKQSRTMLVSCCAQWWAQRVVTVLSLGPDDSTESGRQSYGYAEHG